MFGKVNKLFEWPVFHAEILRRKNFIHSAAMFKRKVWEDICGFNENMNLGWEDYDFWIRAHLKGFKFQKVWETFLYYRIRDNSRNAIVVKENKKKLIKKFKKKYPDFYIGY